MRDSKLMLVEANYDEDMLIGGDYPEFLKRAIESDHGHLSNADAGALSSKSYSDMTEAVVLVHLSKENKTPERARETVEAELGRPRNGPRVDVVEHGGTGGPYRLA